MALVCPNKNTQEWKDLVKEYGEVKAMSAFVMNNEDIPSIEKASDLLNIPIQQTPVQYQAGYINSNLKESEFGIRDLAERLADRIGGKVRFIYDPSRDYSGYNTGNTSTINLANATLDTPIHEILGHPIVRAIKNKGLGKDGTLYQNLLKELEVGYGKEVLNRIKKTYIYKNNLEEGDFELGKYRLSDNKTGYRYFDTLKEATVYLEDVNNKYTLEEQQEEAVVQLLGELTANKIKKIEDNKTLISLLRQLLQQATEYIRSLFNSKEIEIQKLRADITIEDLANLLAYTNSKIILPGYKVEYTTPDGNIFYTYQEASRHISNLFGESKEFNLSSVELDLELTKEEQKEVQRLEKEIQNLGDYLKSEEYKKEKQQKIEDLTKKIEKILHRKPVFYSQEPYLDRKTADKYGFEDFSYVRVESSYSRGKNPHEKFLGKNYVGYYIHGYNTTIHLEDPKLSQKVISITKQQAESIWKNEINTSFLRKLEVKEQQLFYSLQDEKKAVAEDQDIKIKITSLENKIRKITIGDEDIKSFIENNKQFEQSKEAVELWKKENKIVYNPEEVYSRGQGFYSSIGAFAYVELDILLQNLLHHIEDNKKAGGAFVVSAFTKPINTRNIHLEKESSVRYVIYPKPENILWASPIDVGSGNVSDAFKKVSKNKKSELVGVSYTKYPRLHTIEEVSPNLTNIIENLKYSHNELGIELTPTNFRIEYDSTVPYNIKKLVDSVNSILDSKYGKVKKPNISRIQQLTAETFEEEEGFKKRGWIEIGRSEEGFPVFQNKNVKYAVVDVDSAVPADGINRYIFSTIEEAQEYIQSMPEDQRQWYELREIVGGIQPIKTEKNTTSIKNFKDKVTAEDKKYTDKALVNTKVALLKEIAKKHPRSLITSKVVPISEVEKEPTSEDFFFQKTTDEANESIDSKYTERTLQKYEILRRFVPFDVKIEFDETLQDTAKYEPKEKTIYINPLSLSEESIGHEFGHILLLLMNGMRNPLIQKAREQLNNWDKVPSILEEYQDRYDTQEKLDLEVVAQALGKEVTALVEKELNRNTLERLFARIYEWFRSRLGLERNAVKKLANMMLEGKVITDTLEARNIKDVIPLSESTAYMALFKRRAKAKEKNVFEKYDITDGVVDETSLQAFTENAIEVIERKIKLYKSKSKNVPIEKAREYLERVKEANDAEESLYNFIELAYQSTLDIYKDYTLKKHNNNITISTLDSWKDYIGGFGLVDKMYYALRREFEEAYKLTEEGKTSAESKSRKSIYTDKAFEYMRKTIDMKQEIENAYVVEGSRLLADFLAPYHKHVEIELRDYIEKEYYALSKEEKAKISFEDYMEREFGLKEEWLAKATRSSIYKEILQASGDIGTIGRWIDTIIDSKDALVSAMIKVFTEKDAKAHREYTALRYDLIDLVRELENFYSNKYTALTDVRQMYDYMLEKDEYGRYTGYLLTEVKGGFEEQFRRDLEAYKEEESNPDKIEAFVRAWFKENATMDWKVYKKDFFGYIDSLNIPEEELRRYKNALSIKEYQKKGMLVYSTEEVVPESFIKNLETVEKIKEWESRNRKKYRIYADKWKNKDFDKLRNILRNPEDPRTKFYNFIVENTERLQFNLPPSQSIGLRIPAVMKDTAEYAAEGKVKKGLKRKVERTLGVTFEDEETRGTEAPGVADEERGTSRTRLTDELGNPVDFIPILYSRPVTDENGMLREDISLDLGTAFLRYFRMAIEYGYKKEILPELELTKFFLSNRKYIELDAEGRPYIDALDPKKKRLSTKEGSASKIAEMYSDWLEMVIYGKQKKDEGVIPLVNIDFAKGMDVLTQYTAINMLGLNVIQGVANAILGHANDWIEAFGGEHYTVKDFARADVVYMKHLAQTLGDIGQRKPESLVNLLNDQFDTLHEFDGDKVKDNNLFKTLFRVDTMFATSQMGEHMIQSKVMLAMLNNKKAYDVNGKEMGTILDIYKVNPKTKRLEYVEGFSEEKSKWTEKDQLDFQMTLGRIMADLHGDYYQKAKPAFHAYALGRMAGLFRKFIVPGFKRRWSKRHPDTLRGRMVEGYYLSFGRFAGRLLKDLVRFKFQVMSEDWSKITPSEKANIRRGAAEMAFLLATVILITAFTKIEGDDDDDEFERWVYNFARYQSYRFKAEISFFYNPSETLNILRSPAATVGMIQSSIQLLSQLIDPVDGPFERYESGSWEGHMKIEKHATNLFAPGYKQWYRLKYVDDFVTWFK